MGCPLCENEYIDQMRTVPRNGGKSIVCRVTSYYGGIVYAKVIESSDPTISSGHLNYTKSRWEGFPEYDGETIFLGPTELPKSGGTAKGRGKSTEELPSESSLGNEGWEEHDDEAGEEEGEEGDISPPRTQAEEGEVKVTNPLLLGISIPTEITLGLQSLFLPLEIDVSNDDFILNVKKTLRLSRSLSAKIKRKGLSNSIISELNEDICSFLKEHSISFIDIVI